MDIDLGENEEEIDFPQNGGSVLARSVQIQLIRSASELKEAKVVARNDSDKEMSEEEKAESNMILEKTRDNNCYLYEQFNRKASEQEVKDYCRSENELHSEIKKRERHFKEIRVVKKDMFAAQNTISPGSIEDLEKYTESLYELVACRSEKIGRIVKSDVVLDSQELDKVDQSAAIITAPGPKKRKILKDLKANGEDDVEEEDEEENTEEDPPGKNQTGALEKNAAANLKKIEDFEYDMFLLIYSYLLYHILLLIIHIHNVQNI